MKIALWVSVVAGVFAGVLPASQSTPDSQIREVHNERVVAADGTAFDVTRGFIRVPELRQQTRHERSAASIELAVVRARRLGQPRSPSAHVILAGGPGDSGVAQVLGLVRQGGAVFADLVEGDIVGIDQRGTGLSRPNLSSSALYPFPVDQAGSIDSWLPIVQRVSAADAARFRAMGITLEAYNTRESADDVAAVAAALGYPSVTLWGRSYGTHLALATVARHAALAQRLILVSPEGPDHTWKLPSQFDASLKLLEKKGAGDVMSPLSTVLQRLRKAPVEITVAHPESGAPVTIAIGAFDVQWIVSQALGDPRLLVTLPAAIREMSSGDFRRIASIAILRRERTGVQSAMKMMMDLSSGATAGRRMRIEQEARTSLLGTAMNFPGPELAGAWGAVDLGDDFRRPVTGDVPVLLLVGDLDPRTPVANAREIATTLSNAQIVVIENATHQFDMFGTPAIRQVLHEFLRGQPVGRDRVALAPLVFR